METLASVAVASSNTMERYVLNQEEAFGDEEREALEQILSQQPPQLQLHIPPDNLGELPPPKEDPSFDAFLIEVAKDPNLPVDKLLAIAEAVPDSARPEHDGLYKVVDSYLKVKYSFFHSSNSLCHRLVVTYSKVGRYVQTNNSFFA